MIENYYTVGKLVNTHALKGEVRVMAATDFPEQRFAIDSKLTIFDGDKKVTDVIVESARNHKNFIILLFKGLHNINDVEQYKGMELKVSEFQQDDDALEENEYYYHEIIGLEVYTLEGELIGKITAITELISNDVWTIKRPNGKEALIPYIADVVKEIKLDDNKVIIDALEGLID